MSVCPWVAVYANRCIYSGFLYSKSSLLDLPAELPTQVEMLTLLAYGQEMQLTCFIQSIIESFAFPLMSVVSSSSV